MATTVSTVSGVQPPEPDYQGFGEHLQAFTEAGAPIDRRLLLELAGKYNTPIPGTDFWKQEFGDE